MSQPESLQHEDEYEIVAIVGLSARFPGAADAEQFWANLRDGVESIRRFTVAELIAAGEDPARVRAPGYVPASPVLEDIEHFDADFFAIPPREAELMDPQHRLFLEAAWQALEDAGCDPERYPGLIGVVGGVSPNRYLMTNLWSRRDLVSAQGAMSVLIASDRDYMPTRVSYKLDLKGPSLNVQTACSTSLVAVHFACQCLLSHQADVMLAGGVSLQVPQTAGYEYREGDIASPDGHCRPFDADAQGAVFGSGVGLVVLKRLSCARADGDQIYAVIRGTAINNDGAAKVGYTAPGLDGQAAVIAMAHGAAGVTPDSIDYVETHGTGTPLGDPIEVHALTQVFAASGERRQPCALGSVKSNIGHTDAAAGVAGLIKTALALRHRQLPPSLHFRTPNPQIDFARGLFYVNTALRDWTATAGRPRRAGVSAFGIGGTNAHAVLEEAPKEEIEEAPADARAATARPWQLLVLSARTPAALDAATARLSAHLARHPEQPLADVAATLQLGRRAFAERRVVACRSHAEAIARLGDARALPGGRAGDRRPPIVFMFPGGGAQYSGMAAELYAHEPTFAAAIDRCAALSRAPLDLRAALRPHSATAPAPELSRAATALPALFAVEYALAQLLGSWGIRPRALIGHSLGEYVAACLAGVFRLEDALELVTLRGRLFDELPPGGMLSLPLSEAETRALLPAALDLAAVNAPGQCVVSGPNDALAAFGATLVARGVDSRRLHIDVAAHSSMLTPILDRFRGFVARLTLSAPTLPLMSNLTGDWLTAAEATSPDYWTAHLRQTVRFGDGLQELTREPGQLLVEVGPGRTLHSLVKLSPAGARASAVVTTLRHPHDEQPDQAFLLSALGRLWIAGADVDWTALHAPCRPRRVSLPTYPFERQRYWIDAIAPTTMGTTDAPTTAPRALHERPSALGKVAPVCSEVERAIVAIWQQLLGIRDIGVDDDFFELGGNSLVMTQVLNQVQRAFAVPLAIRELFLHPRVSALAALIESRRPSVDAAPTPLTPRLRAAFPRERLALLTAELRALAPLERDVAAAQLSQRLELTLGVDELAAPSLDALARQLLTRLGLSGDDAPVPPDVGALSDDEVQRLLCQALSDEEVAL